MWFLTLIFDFQVKDLTIVKNAIKTSKHLRLSKGINPSTYLRKPLNLKKFSSATCVEKSFVSCAIWIDIQEFILEKNHRYVTSATDVSNRLIISISICSSIRKKNLSNVIFATRNLVEMMF